MRVKFLESFNQALFLMGIFTLLFLFAACDRPSEELPLTPPFQHPMARENIGYGVVTVSFAHIYNEPGAGGISLGHFRQGTVLRLLERRPILNRGTSEFWVLAEANFEGEEASVGWLNEALLEVFNSESRARTASRALSH